jgi:hypothetical protein
MQKPAVRWSLLSGVLAVAAWLRLGYPGVVAFAFDEARLSLIALGTARGGEFATLGMTSSAGTPNMPAAAWLFALPYAVAPSPLLASLTVGLVGVLATWGLWRLARPWGLTAALVAALFFAAHPFAVLYGRSVWAQNLLAPLAVLWLAAAHRAAVRERAPLSVGLAAFLSGFALQVHFAGAALALAGAYAFFRWRWWRQPIAFLAGAGLAILAAIPFALTPGAVDSLFNAAGGTAVIDAAAWTDAVQLVAGYDWAYLLQGDAELPLNRLTPTVLYTGLGLLLAAGVALAGLFGAAALFGVEDTTVPETTETVTDSAASDNRALLELALATLLAAPLLFTRHSTPVFLHYLLTSLPAAALLLGWLAADRRRPPLRHTVSALAVVLALAWTGGLSRGLAFAGQQHTPNGLPEPLTTLNTAAAAPPAGRPVVFHTHGDDPAVHGEAAIFSALWWGRDDARIVDGRSVLVLPPEPATLMFTERAFQSWEEARESNLLDEAWQVPRRAGIAPFELAPNTPADEIAGFEMLPQPVEFAHGATLLGWRTYVVGPRTRVSTMWAAAGPIDGSIQQFHHLRTSTNPDGPPDYGADVSVRGASWRAGDRVVVIGDFIDLPAGEYTLQVGHYTLPDVARVPLAGGGDVVTLGELRTR